MLVVLLNLISLTAQASEPNWMCSEVASVRRNNSILACGKASSVSLPEAQKEAFKQAQNEFNTVCAASDDCINHPVVVDPKRTVCSQLKGIITCTRLIEFAIGAIQLTVDGKPVYTLTSYKIRLGMTKQQVLKILGIPTATEHYEYQDQTQWIYLNHSACRYDATCHLMFINGKVVKYTDFKPEVGEDLL